MARPLRIQTPRTFHFLTFRCAQQQFLLRPDPICNEIFGYTLAQALEKYPGIALLGSVSMGNHCHLVVQDRRSELERFMQLFESRLALRINAHRHRRGAFIERRYSGEPIFGDQALIERLVYLVTNPTSAGLVESWGDWPGIVLWAHTGEPMEHTYEILDETKYLLACAKAVRNRKRRPPKRDFMLQRTLVVEPMRDGDKIMDMQTVVDAVDVHEHDVAKRRAHAGKRRVLGAAKVLKTSPFARPKKPKTSKRPLCHASREVWDQYRALYFAIRTAFLDASIRFRDGEIDAVFPDWTHPPALPLVRAAPG